MTLDAGLLERLWFFVRVVEKEKKHLAFSSKKLFIEEFAEQKNRLYTEKVDRALAR
jgi:hypothetical protein